MNSGSKLLALAFLVLAAFVQPALAENIQATHCQLFVKEVWAAPSSHGMATLGATVKVNFLGNNEYIQRVQFYGKLIATDLGNASNCHYGSDPRADDQFHFFDSATTSSGRAVGEYKFSFPILSGSVLGACRGYQYASVGSFLVQTNKNTYWLNPNFDPNQQFFMDYNGYQRLPSYAPASTLRDDLRYYNPGSCR